MYSQYKFITNYWIFQTWSFCAYKFCSYKCEQLSVTLFIHTLSWCLVPQYWTNGRWIEAWEIKLWKHGKKNLFHGDESNIQYSPHLRVLLGTMDINTKLRIFLNLCNLTMRLLITDMGSLQLNTKQGKYFLSPLHIYSSPPTENTAYH